MPVGSYPRAFSLALLYPKDIVDNAVWDRAQPLDSAARERYHGLWRQLRVENAPLACSAAKFFQDYPLMVQWGCPVRCGGIARCMGRS
jgi:hypothetical protein